MADYSLLYFYQSLDLDSQSIKQVFFKHFSSTLASNTDATFICKLISPFEDETQVVGVQLSATQFLAVSRCNNNIIDQIRLFSITLRSCCNAEPLTQVAILSKSFGEHAVLNIVQHY